MRIIGIELRAVVQTRKGIEQKEIGIIPCDIQVEIPQEFDFGQTQRMNMTLHTDKGDIAVQDFNVDGYFFQENFGALRFKQHK